MISKAYLRGAARAYIRAQIWHLDVAPSTVNRPQRRSGLLKQHVQHVVFRYLFQAYELHEYDTLRFITATVRKLDFGRMAEGKVMWTGQCESLDFANAGMTGNLQKLSGLEKVVIIAGSCRFANTETKKTLWQKSVGRLDDFVRAIVCRPRPQGQADVAGRKIISGPVPLYRGSKVCFDTHKMIEHAHGFESQQASPSQATPAVNHTADAARDAAGRVADQPVIKTPAKAVGANNVEKPVKLVQSAASMRIEQSTIGMRGLSITDGGLRDLDIHAAEDELLLLMRTRGSDMLKWIRAKKAGVNVAVKRQ